MSYDNILVQDRYFWFALAFGSSGTQTITGRGPKGKTGYVRDIMVDVTTAMVGTTTVPEIQVGVGGTLAAYARFRLGTTATAGYGTGVKRASVLCSTAQGNTGGVPPALTDFAGHVLLETARLPADTDYLISLIAGTGGSPAGTANISIQIDWF